MRHFKSSALSSIIAMLSLSLLASGCGLKTGANTTSGTNDTQEEVLPNSMKDNSGVQKEAKEQKYRTLRLMQFSLILLNAKYVEPDRLNWRKMTTYGIDALQNMVPEVVAQFDRRIDESPSSLTLRVGLESKHFNLGRISTLSEAWQISEDAYNFIYSNLLDPKDPDELEYAMINGMFSTLDPHTNLLPPYLFEDVMTGNGGFGGCGFVVGVRDDNLTVISPMEGAPAWKVGIKAGDIIVRIDDESTENMPLQDAVDRMRGDVGTQVTLYIKRRGWTEARPFAITREQIQIKSVTSEALKSDNVGYIKLKSFDQTTAAEVKLHLAELHKSMPKMQGLILDLRNNSGGLLEQSIAVAELFLSKGDTIVSVEGPTRADKSSTKAKADGTERNYPLIVLINEGSASASEIVAGALQFHNRAVIVGERSFGKGSVQILKDNPDGSAVKITSAQYLTPGDISIQGVGIVPDIRLISAFVDEKDGISLVETQNIRREDNLEQSLHSSKTIERTSAKSLRYLYEPSKEDEERAKEIGITTYDLRSTENYAEDSETRFAINLIKQAKSANRPEIIQNSSSFFEQYELNYRSALKTALQKLKIDWNTSTEKPCDQFTWGIKLDETTVGENETLEFAADGVEKQLIMWVKNTCEDAELAQFSATMSSNNGAFDEREFAFGKIKPGEQREWPVKIKLPKSMPTRDDIVNIQFYQGDDALLTNTPLETKGVFTASVINKNKPSFAYTYWIDDISRGNADGNLSRGESVDMYLWVKNIGNADSEKVKIHIANESGSGVLLQQGSATIENLAAGTSKLVMLKFDVSQDRPQKPPSKRIKRDRPFNPDEVFLNLTIEDTSYDAQVVQPIYLPVAQTPVQPAVRDSEMPETIDENVKSIAQNAVLLSRPQAGIAIGNIKESQNVRIHQLENGYIGVCWKEDDLNPCAFVAKDALNDALPDNKPVENSNVSANFSYEPPHIVFEERSHTETASTVTIFAVLTDNEALRDYEAYVWTHDGLQLKSEKLDYGMVTGKEKRVAIEMPLKQGDNNLVLIARDRLDTETVQIFHVNRP